MKRHERLESMVNENVRIKCLGQYFNRNVLTEQSYALLI